MVKSPYIDELPQGTPWEPIYVPPKEEDRYFLVGKQEYKATITEWICSQLKEGDLIYALRGPTGTPTDSANQDRMPFTAIVKRSWFYDGIVLDVVHDDIDIGLHPSFANNRHDRVLPTMKVCWETHPMLCSYCGGQEPARCKHCHETGFDPERLPSRPIIYGSRIPLTSQ